MKIYKTFYCVFFGIFIVVGTALAVYGFVKLAEYNFAGRVEAEVVSVEYGSGDYEVTFAFAKNGERVQTSALFDGVNYNKNGHLKYYVGKTVEIRIDKNNKIVRYGKNEIIITACGVLFAVVGAGFLYFFILKKQNAIDAAYEYEKAMMNPDEVTDGTAKYEAEADALTKLPKYALRRMAGESKIWGLRIVDRFKSFTVFEKVLYGALLFVPMVVLSVCPLFFGKNISAGHVLNAIIVWLFVGCFSGAALKAIYSLYIKTLVKRGKFTEKKLATVLCAAFESSAYFQSGTFSRTHTVFKKFRVVAAVDGKRSIGYVKGNIPPPKGAVLKVLVRPNKPKKWIIDIGD